MPAGVIAVSHEALGRGGQLFCFEASTGTVLWSHDFVKEDARTVYFPVKVAAGAEVTVRYTVQYTW